MDKKAILKKRGELGKQLRDNRKAYGISQASLSLHSGLSTRTIGAMERGTLKWTVDTEIAYLTSLKALAEYSFNLRKHVKGYTPPILLPPDRAIFSKYL